MAALDMHEQEQVEALKHWWREHGMQTVIAIVLAAIVGGAILGWKYWHGREESKAAVLFGNVVKEMGSNDPKRVDAAAAAVADKYGSTVYAARAQLLAARMNAMARNTSAAMSDLHWVIDNASDEGLKHAARLQLASMLLDEKKYDDALTVLDAAHPAAFDSLYLNLKGDVYAAEGKNDAARTAYSSALEQAQSKGQFVTALRLKLEALGGDQKNGGTASSSGTAATVPGGAK
jgi:predicted negative regulator of RcsB-dependent stress response